MSPQSAVPPAAECVTTLLRSLVGGDAQGSALRTLQDGMDEVQRHMGAPWRRYPFMRLLKARINTVSPTRLLVVGRRRAGCVGMRLASVTALCFQFHKAMQAPRVREESVLP